MYSANGQRMMRSVTLSNRERLRRAKQESTLGLHAYLTLLAVLAQCGGEKVVTEGTLDHVSRNLATLSFTTMPSPTTPHEFIVRLVEGAPDADLIKNQQEHT
mgnify:CR=1 FL=1